MTTEDSLGRALLVVTEMRQAIKDMSKSLVNLAALRNEKPRLDKEIDAWFVANYTGLHEMANRLSLAAQALEQLETPEN